MTYEIQTRCEDCDNVEPQSKKGAPYNWLCMKFINLIDSPLSETMRTKAPYMRCSGINGGKCPCYEPLRTNQINIPLGE